MQTSTSIWTVAGDGYSNERRILGVWFFYRHATQKWSPLLIEGRSEYGLRIRNFRVSIGWTWNHWHDGKEPKTTVPARLS